MTEDVHTMPMPDLPPLSLPALLTQWTVEPLLTSVAVALAVGYLVALSRVRSGAVPVRWPAWPTVLFLTGVAVLVLTADSGIGRYGYVLFWMHMVQHLLLIMVVPSLLASGRPLGLVLAALPSRARRGWLRTLRSAPVAAITHPACGIAFYTAVIVTTHLTTFPEVMATRHWVHVGELMLYLAAGCLLFIPLIGREPLRWRPSFLGMAFALALTMPVDTFTGLLLMLSGAPRWPTVAAMTPVWGPSPLFDVQIAGGIMWVGGDWIMIMIILIMFAVWQRTVSRHGTRSQGAGRWLESVRRATLVDRVGGAADATGTGQDIGGNIDDDDRALAAYNAYLRRLHQPRQPPGAREQDIEAGPEAH